MVVFTDFVQNYFERLWLGVLNLAEEQVGACLDTVYNFFIIVRVDRNVKQGKFLFFHHLIGLVHDRCKEIFLLLCSNFYDHQASNSDFAFGFKNRHDIFV